MRVVIDTNVLVSGLISPHGVPARIIDLAFLGQIICVYDDRILAEYAEVLARPKFSRVIRPQDRDDILDFFERLGERVLAEPLILPPDIPDKDDLPFIEVAVAGQARLLITGNMEHFACFDRCGLIVRAATPAEALALLCS